VASREVSKRALINNSKDCTHQTFISKRACLKHMVSFGRASQRPFSPAFELHHRNRGEVTKQLTLKREKKKI
jgi:hypothetical protein